MISSKKTSEVAKIIENPIYVEYDSKEIEFDLKKIKFFYLIYSISSIYVSLLIFGLTLEIKNLYFFSEMLQIVLLVMLSIYLIKKGRFQKKLGVCLGILTIFILLSNLLATNKKSYSFSSLMIRGPNFNFYGISTSFNPIIIFYFLLFIGIFVLINRLKPSNKKSKNGNFTQIFKILMNNPSTYKKLLLLLLISLLTLYEEVIFRYLLINVIISYTNLDLFFTIMLVSLTFTLLHVFNHKKLDKITIIHLNICFFYSIIFSITMISNGLFYAWLLHFFWNFLLILCIIAKKES